MKNIKISVEFIEEEVKKKGSTLIERLKEEQESLKFIKSKSEDNVRTACTELFKIIKELTKEQNELLGFEFWNTGCITHFNVQVNHGESYDLIGVEMHDNFTTHAYYSERNIIYVGFVYENITKGNITYKKVDYSKPYVKLQKQDRKYIFGDTILIEKVYDVYEDIYEKRALNLIRK